MTAKTLMVANTDWYLYNFKLSLADALRDEGFEVVMVSPAGEFSPRLAEKGYRHIPWEVGRQSILPWQEIGSILALRKIYLAEKPDLVQHFTIKPVLYGGIAAMTTGIRRQLITITGRGYVFLTDELKAKLVRPLTRLLYRQVFSGRGVRVIFENDADREYFIAGKFIPPHRTRLIEGVGVDIDFFTPAPEPEGEPVIAYTGRLLWDKGVGDLVEAAREVRSQIPLKVLLTGEPDPGNPSSIDPRVIQTWVAEGFVEWQGFQENVKTVYEQSHIIALPSRFEGVPTVLLEAAACGRAIVASDIPGCRVAVEHEVSGLLTPVGDVQALAVALERLLSDGELRRRMGAAGRERALRLFTKQRINQATIELIREMLAG